MKNRDGTFPVLANLTDFDTYLFSHWMARHGTFNVLSLKKELLNPAQHHQLENYCMESKLCKSKEVLEQAEAIMLKLKFFQRYMRPAQFSCTIIPVSYVVCGCPRRTWAP